MSDGDSVPELLPACTALVLIDIQIGFDEIEAAGSERNNHDAIRMISLLLEAFRTYRAAILHVRHASTDPKSVFSPDRPGFRVKDEAREIPGEDVIQKRVNSAFIGTDLEERLRVSGITHVVMAGATTNHCVETTARMAGNLGFNVLLVRDATWTFARTGPDGDHHTAHEVHAMSLSNLNGEFAEIVTADQVVARLEHTVKKGMHLLGRSIPQR